VNLALEYITYHEGRALLRIKSMQVNPARPEAIYDNDFALSAIYEILKGSTFCFV
jgi:hypothetical protein